MAALRILVVSQMWPGPRDPDLGTFVAQVSRQLQALGHDVDHAVLDTRRGGPARHLKLLGRALRAKRPDVVFAHFCPHRASVRCWPSARRWS